ncbi:MAG: membrane protein insertion efficiency factor YidD [Candidatus Omnitrophota bacterium]
MKTIFVIIVKIYRMCISPYLTRSCRHVPSCSEYSIEAVETFGFLRGILMSAKRLLRCHPFSKGGYDPVVKERE